MLQMDLRALKNYLNTLFRDLETAINETQIRSTFARTVTCFGKSIRR
jgi:hypothetical protein